jgi:hypothetical protein
MGSLSQRIKTLSEVLEKNHPLPDVDQVKIWHKELEEQ